MPGNAKRDHVIISFYQVKIVVSCMLRFSSSSFILGCQTFLEVNMSIANIIVPRVFFSVTEGVHTNVDDFCELSKGTEQKRSFIKRI